MAWFIGQSAVMIVLAFLLGLFVGWLIWGRRVHTLLIEIRDLRTRVAELESNSGAAKLPAAVERPVAVEEHEEPVHEDESVVVPATVNSAGSVGTNAAVADRPAANDSAVLSDSTALSGSAASSGSVASSGSGAATKASKRASTAKPPIVTASPAEPMVDESAASVPVHIPAPRTEMAGPTVVPDEDLVSSAGSIGVAEPDADTDSDMDSDSDSDSDSDGAGRAHAGTVADSDDVVDSAGSIGLGASEAAARSEASEASEAQDSGPIDNLARIEGIGPKIAAALVTAGIRTYAQLADSDEVSLTKAINTAGIHFAPSMPTWAPQARLLADGDEAAFITLTDRLIAGREVAAAEAATTAPDDFARIEGIGPKIAAALVTSGIRTFAQLAAADEDTLTAAIRTAGITFAPSIVSWSDQARLLADGDEERFAELTARLIAGRRPDDDLERIEGIGPKMAAALHTAGIRTYRVLADSDDAKLRAAITAAGLSFAPSVVTWSRQARLLADGDEDGFADLTRRLVAGRDEGRA